MIPHKICWLSISHYAVWRRGGNVDYQSSSFPKTVAGVSASCRKSVNLFTRSKMENRVSMKRWHIEKVINANSPKSLFCLKWKIGKKKINKERSYLRNDSGKFFKICEKRQFIFKYSFFTSSTNTCSNLLIIFVSSFTFFLGFLSYRYCLLLCEVSGMIKNICWISIFFNFSNRFLVLAR